MLFLCFAILTSAPIDVPLGTDLPNFPAGTRVLHVLEDERPDHFGWGIVGLGDVDADGTPDFYVGARCGVWGLTQSRGYGDVFSGKSGRLLYRVEGEEDPEGDTFGITARVMADVDGDGAADLAVRGEPMSAWVSYVKLFSGRTGKVLRDWRGCSDVVDVGDLDGDGKREIVLVNEGRSEVRDLESNALKFEVHSQVLAATGDSNGDGVRDLIVLGNVEFKRGEKSTLAMIRSGRDGSLLTSFPDPTHGAVVYRYLPAGDANGDGFVDVAFAFYASPPEMWRMPAQEPCFRMVIVSGKDGSVLRDWMEELGGKGDIHDPRDVGDVDGDGCSDLFVARFGGGLSPSSRARIYSGKTGKELAVLSGADWSLGVSAGNVGDLDGDGRPELVIGEHEHGRCQGRAYVISLGKKQP